MKPLVSIIMPCYNAAKYLRYALVSIEEQSYKNFELVVINDGSSDNTEAILNEFDRGKIVYIFNDKNEGVSGSLNKGLAAARGEFIARFDADDFMYDYRLRDQVFFLLENDQIDLVGGGADVFGDLGTIYRPAASHEAIIDQMLLNNPMIHSTIMLRRTLVDKGVYSYRANWRTEEDYELWGRLFPKIRASNIQHSLIRYRIHGANNQRIPGKLEAKRKVLRSFLAQYQITDDALIEALAEFQCSGFISFENYQILRNYALRAEKQKLPKLAWLHDWIVYEKRYHLFMDYYMSRL